MTMDILLYVRVRGRIAGPFDLDQLQALARKGQLSRMHEVSTDQMSWTQAGSSHPEIWEGWTTKVETPVEPVVEQPVTGQPGPEVDSGELIWHYTKNDEQQEPVSQEQLKKLFSLGELQAHDQVWTEGMSEWQPAAEVPQLAFCFNKPEQPANPVSPSGSTPSIIINTASNTGQAGSQARGKPAGFSITSMVLGILSLIPCFGILLGILAIIFGFVALGRVSSGVGGGKGMAITGLVCGILAVVGWLLLFVLFIFLPSWTLPLAGGMGAAGQSF